MSGLPSACITLQGLHFDRQAGFQQEMLGWRQQRSKRFCEKLADQRPCREAHCQAGSVPPMDTGEGCRAFHRTAPWQKCCPAHTGACPDGTTPDSVCSTAGILLLQGLHKHCSGQGCCKAACLRQELSKSHIYLFLQCAEQHALHYAMNMRLHVVCKSVLTSHVVYSWKCFCM